jgi:DNA-binding CsgD family transcriptional regulator
MASWNFDAIERSFADAAVQPELWNKAMDTIAAETGSVGTILFPPQELVIPNVPSSEAVQRCSETYFRDGWHARDERFRCWNTIMQRGVADDFNFIDRDDMKRHPYYQEFLQPHGLQYFAGVRMAAGEDHWCVSIQRSTQQGPFSPKEMLTLAKLSKKIAGAAALARALGFASANAAVEALELSGSAVALLNRSGEVLRLNRTAESLLGLELRVVKRRLVSHDQNATIALDRALQALLWSNAQAALMPPVAFPRRGKRSLLAYPIKLSTVSLNIFADCQAILVLVDLEKRPRPPQEALHTSFALTPAEARIAVRIGSGEDLVSIADELGISKETARRQLASVFQKTRVNRQAELVSLLASLFYSRP